MDVTEARSARRNSRRRRGGLSLVAALVTACCLVAPGVASAAQDPDHLQFSLQGCRLPVGETLPNADGDFICADADYTPGNLGKNWNELDLVPHRLTVDGGPAQTFATAIAADYMDAGRPGYDVISVPVVNTRLSVGTCSLDSATDQAILDPGVGGTDQSIYRILTITQSKGAHCVFDYYERLALGSHLFPGSSLHSDLLNQNLDTSNIGARDVPLPVNQISAQTLGKTMTATTGSTKSWNITKDSSPAHLDFNDTCTPGAATHTANVTITVNWTKSTVNAALITIVTNITLTNPASRSIDANVQDKMYAGNTQTTQVGSTYNSGTVTVPANSTRTITDTQTVPAGSGTSFNDVATATYTDNVTHVAIPGSTTATASANLVTITTPNDSADISDVEQITGDGLSFAVGSTVPAGEESGFQGGYTLGTSTTGPLTWLKHVTDSGGVVFNKTVTVDGARNTTGTLSDVATLTDAAWTTHTATGATTITARGCITGHKFNDVNGNGVQDAGDGPIQGITIYVDVNGNGALDAGEPSAVTDAAGNYSISTAGIPDGNYALREVVPGGQTCTFPANCAYVVTVGPGPAITGRDFGDYTPPTPPVAPPTGGTGGIVGGESTPPTTPPVHGTASIHGVKACVAKAFRISVTGKKITKVRFYMDGRLVKTLKHANSGSSWVLKVNPKNIGYSKHHVVTKVDFSKASQTKSRTLKTTFQRCARVAATPKFTG